jgi:hypothetical protein
MSPDLQFAAPQTVKNVMLMMDSRKVRSLLYAGPQIESGRHAGQLHFRWNLIVMPEGTNRARLHHV